MRKISRIAADKFNSNTNWKKDNTEVISDGDVTKMRLFGNMIAIKKSKKDITRISNGGWNSVTTRDRLLGLGADLFQKNFEWFLSDESWDGSWININPIEEIIPEKKTNPMDMMTAFLKLGEITNPDETLANKVAYKQRIVFATMRASIPGWQEPYDWARLPDEQKMERLLKIEAL